MAAAVFKQVEPAIELGPGRDLAGLLRKSHGASAGGADAAGGQFIRHLFSIDQPAVLEVADIDGAGHGRDRLDLLCVADDQRAFGQGERGPGDLGKDLPCLVDDQQVDEVVKALGRELASPVAAARQFSRQAGKGGHGAGRQHHAALPAWLDGLSPSFFMRRGDGAKIGLHRHQPSAFPVVGDEQKQVETGSEVSLPLQRVQVIRASERL